MVKSKFLIIVGIHGNESFSIPILERLEKIYNPNRFGYDWIVGNPLAVSRNARYVDTDLNRCAPVT
jgi:succinylglutamate desuccinylase